MAGDGFPTGLGVGVLLGVALSMTVNIATGQTTYESWQRGWCAGRGGVAHADICVVGTSAIPIPPQVESPAGADTPSTPKAE